MTIAPIIGDDRPQHERDKDALARTINRLKVSRSADTSPSSVTLLYRARFAFEAQLEVVTGLSAAAIREALA